MGVKFDVSPDAQSSRDSNFPGPAFLSSGANNSHPQFPEFPDPHPPRRQEDIKFDAVGTARPRGARFAMPQFPWPDVFKVPEHILSIRNFPNFRTPSAYFTRGLNSLYSSRRKVRDIPISPTWRLNVLEAIIVIRNFPNFRIPARLFCQDNITRCILIGA